MFSKRTVIITVVIMLLAFCVIGLSLSGKRGRTSYGSSVAIYFVAPFQKGFTHSIRFVKNLWRHYFFLASVAKTNDALKRELSHATERVNQCNETELSNARLRSLLNFRETINRQVVAAEVISKDPSPWFKSILIDKGSSDGLKKGVPVVIPEGVVGLVTDISTHYSKVLLVVDQNSAVDALVQRTRARGIIKGGTAGRCLFKYVLRKHDIVESDIVVSSGLDGVFPKGLRVGTVSNVTRRNSGIFQEVTVIPYVDFEKLEEVLVILNLPRYAPAYYDHFKSGVSER